MRGLILKHGRFRGEGIARSCAEQAFEGTVAAMPCYGCPGRK